MLRTPHRSHRQRFSSAGIDGRRGYGRGSSYGAHLRSHGGDQWLPHPLRLLLSGLAGDVLQQEGLELLELLQLLELGLGGAERERGREGGREERGLASDWALCFLH